MNELAAAEHSAVSNPRLAVQAVLRTDVGLIRSENQDFGAFTSPQEERDSQPGGRLLIVADGMGGHRGGATASRLATETVREQYLNSETKDVGEALREALIRANARVFSEAQGNPDLRGMGTTTSALVLRDSQGWLGHVGDSRIYRVRSGVIEQLTDDHSLVASMVREGLLTAKEAETHPRRNVLQRSLGVGEQVEIDIRGPFEVIEGDLFIICSDGLHGLVKQEELGEIAALPLQQAADECVRRTLERGAPDNVTVIVAKAIRADELGDETLTDVGADTLTLTQTKLEEMHRDTAPIPPLVETPAATPAPPLQQQPPALAPAAAEPVSPPVSQPAPPIAPAAAAQPADMGAKPPAPARSMPVRTATEASGMRKASAPRPVRSTQTATPPSQAQKSSGKGWKWILIVLFVGAGAAGAWLYWNHQQVTAIRRSSAPQSR